MKLVTVRKRIGKGFLTWRESGARLTVKTEQAGLKSVDLGRISIEDAQKKAWLHKVVLLVDGRIYGRSPALAVR